MRQKELRKKKRLKYEDALEELKFLARQISIGNALYNKTRDLKILNNIHKLRVELQEKEREHQKHLHKKRLSDDIQKSGRGDNGTIRPEWQGRSYYSQAET